LINNNNNNNKYLNLRKNVIVQMLQSAYSITMQHNQSQADKMVHPDHIYLF